MWELVTYFWALCFRHLGFGVYLIPGGVPSIRAPPLTPDPPAVVVLGVFIVLMIVPGLGVQTGSQVQALHQNLQFCRSQTRAPSGGVQPLFLASGRTFTHGCEVLRPQVSHQEVQEEALLRQRAADDAPALQGVKQHAAQHRTRFLVLLRRGRVDLRHDVTRRHAALVTTDREKGRIQEEVQTKTAFRAHLCAVGPVVVVELVDQHRQAAQVHALVSVAPVRVCELVYEGAGPLSPQALLHRRADQDGRGEVEQTPGSENRELGQAHGGGPLSGAAPSDPEDRLVAQQLVQGPEEVTLFTRRNRDSIIKGEFFKNGVNLCLFFLPKTPEANEGFDHWWKPSKT